MATTPAELAEKIDEWIACWGYEGEPTGRLGALKKIGDYIAEHGFPDDPAGRRKLTIVPMVNHEANYDGIPWTHQDADLSHMRFWFETDFAIQCGGLSRQEASKEQFDRYVRFSLDALR